MIECVKQIIVSLSSRRNTHLCVYLTISVEKRMTKRFMQYHYAPVRGDKATAMSRQKANGGGGTVWTETGWLESCIAWSELVSKRCGGSDPQRSRSGATVDQNRVKDGGRAGKVSAAPDTRLATGGHVCPLRQEEEPGQKHFNNVDPQKEKFKWFRRPRRRLTSFGKNVVPDHE